MTPVEPAAGPRPVDPVEGRSDRDEHQPIVVVDQLSLHYGEDPAFQDVTVSIKTRCITALVGPSGCGKTSFLTCLNRLTDLIPGTRVTGSIRLNDLDVLAPRTNVIQLRRRIGMIFQKPNPFPFSIRKNLEFPCASMGAETRNRSPARWSQDSGTWACGTRSRTGWTRRRSRCLAANNRGCASPERWSSRPMYSSWTSRVVRSIPSPVVWSRI